MAQRLKCPFPYHGGKSRVADIVWSKFGQVERYLEPFFGSGAVLLANPQQPYPFEVVCDLSGYICNFWRAVKAEPETVAEWATYPTIHQDLTARQIHIYRWLIEYSKRLSEDAEFYDAKIAGWWVWGSALWIAVGRYGNFEYNTIPVINPCDGGKEVSMQGRSGKDRPHVRTHNGSSGTSMQKEFYERRPPIRPEGGGKGVSLQTQGADGIPNVRDGGGGKGVSLQIEASSGEPDSKLVLHKEFLLDWFKRLQARLAAVTVLNRDWKSCTSPSVMGNTKTRQCDVAIFLDPPYLTSDRGNLYASDHQGTSDQVAVEAYKWAVEHGNKHKIAYCCHMGDFEVPDGWTSHVSTFAGIRAEERRTDDRRDLIMFSPKCVGEKDIWA